MALGTNYARGETPKQQEAFWLKWAKHELNAGKTKEQYLAQFKEDWRGFQETIWDRASGTEMPKARFYADLNPAFGAWQEKRYVVIDRNTGRPVARFTAPQYATKKAAEKSAVRLNELDSLL